MAGQKKKESLSISKAETYKTDARYRLSPEDTVQLERLAKAMGFKNGSQIITQALRQMSDATLINYETGLKINLSDLPRGLLDIAPETIEKIEQDKHDLLSSDSETERSQSGKKKEESSEARESEKSATETESEEAVGAKSEDDSVAEKAESDGGSEEAKDNDDGELSELDIDAFNQ